MRKEAKLTFKTGINNALKENKLGSIESVPYGNTAAVKTLLGDDKPYEFINSVKLGEDHPASPDPWTTVILTTEWAESFAAKVNTTPQPLFIGGHAEYGLSAKERAIPDGYLTGALVLGEELFIRNSLPSFKSEEKKERVEQATREIAVKMLSTSTSSYNLYDIEVNDEDYKDKYIAKEAVKGISNALVEADQTGSDADIVVTSFKADGFETKNKGEEQVSDKVTTNVEMFTSLKNQLDSGRLALSDIATSLGIELMTSEGRASLKRLSDVETKVGNITEFVESVMAEKEVAFASLKEAKIKEKFKDEPLIEIAEPLFALKEGDSAAIEAEVNRIAELQVFKTIQGKIAGTNFVPGGSEDVTLDNSSSERMEA